MKLSVAQTRPFPGDIHRNITVHRQLIALAASAGAGMVIFPELSVTGYEPTMANELAVLPDDSRFNDFQTLSDRWKITIGVGVPLRSPDGIRISVLLFQPEQARQWYSKQYLHPDEEPFFVPGLPSPGLIGEQLNVALAICYEISIPEHASNASRNGADVYIASVAKSTGGIEKALERLSDVARRYSMPVMMSNCIGILDGCECAGRSSVWNRHGELLAHLGEENEGLIVLDTVTQTATRFVI